MLRRWEELPGRARVAHPVQARRIGENLVAIGCFMVSAVDLALDFSFDDEV
ncbi:hypothetical protein GZH49_39515 [Nocardia terpenica]|uniref:hypothetical protein n=1 Tax=Nocardia terpenica TaxID=455432 RepID=UPI002FE02D1B